MPRPVFAARLPHERVRDGQKLHDSLVEVEIFEAFEEVGITLAVTAGLKLDQNMLLLSYWLHVKSPNKKS